MTSNAAMQVVSVPEIEFIVGAQGNESNKTTVVLGSDVGQFEPAPLVPEIPGELQFALLSSLNIIVPEVSFPERLFLVFRVFWTVSSSPQAPGVTGELQSVMMFCFHITVHEVSLAANRALVLKMTQNSF